MTGPELFPVEHSTARFLAVMGLDPAAPRRERLVFQAWRKLSDLAYRGLTDAQIDAGAVKGWRAAVEWLAIWCHDTGVRMVRRRIPGRRP